MEIDIQFERHGSIAIIQPLSEAGRGWCDENVCADEWQKLNGGAIATEPRYVDAIIFGAQADGLEIITL